MILIEFIDSSDSKLLNNKDCSFSNNLKEQKNNSRVFRNDQCVLPYHCCSKYLETSRSSLEKKAFVRIITPVKIGSPHLRMSCKYHRNPEPSSRENGMNEAISFSVIRCFPNTHPTLKGTGIALLTLAMTGQRGPVASFREFTS